MTVHYSRVASPNGQRKAGACRLGALEKLLPHRMARAGRWMNKDAERDRLFWANIVTPSEACRPDGGHGSAYSFILQQDPDGCWFLDQWKQDSAGVARPISTAAARHEATRRRREPADACFIIEIG